MFAGEEASRLGAAGFGGTTRAGDRARTGQGRQGAATADAGVAGYQGAGTQVRQEHR